MGAVKGDGGFWFIYLTHWGLMIETTYLGFAVYTTYASATRWAQEDAADKSLPWYVRAMWLLYAIALPMTFAIVVLYWGLVFNGNVTVLSVCTHGLNFLVMFLDSLVGRMPYLLLHGLYFGLAGFAYLAWSAVPYATGIGNEQGGPLIYSSLDWGNPEATGKLGAAILLVVFPILNCIFWVFVNLTNCSCLPGMALPTDVEASEVAQAGPPSAVDAMKGS